MDRPSSVQERFSGALGSTVRILLGFTIFVMSPFVPALLNQPWWLGFLSFILGLIVIYAFAGTKEYGVWEWGVKKRVEQRQIADDELEYCDACGDIAAGGVMRRYAKQVAFLGSPMKTLDWGGNTYCEECAGATTKEVVIPSAVQEQAESGPSPVPEAETEAEGDGETSTIPGISD